MNGEIGVAGTRLVSDNLILRSDRVERAARARLRSLRRPLPRRHPGAGEQLSGRRRRPVRRHHQSRHDQRPGAASASSGRVAARTPADRQCDARATCSAASARSPPASSMEPVGPDPRQQYPARRAGAHASPRAAAPIGRNGALDLRLAGVSRAYGPLAVHVTGTATRAADRARRRQPRLRHRPPRTSAPRSARPPAAGRSRRPASPPTGRSRPTSSSSPAAGR